MMADFKGQIASAESGFIFSAPPIENPFEADAAYQRILQAYLPASIYQDIRGSLHDLAEEAISPRVLEMLSNAEKNVSYVKTHDSWGRRYDVDRLITSEGWKYLGQWGAQRGVVATGYESEYGEYRRLVQFSKLYLYMPSSGVYSCPFAMTDGAARLLDVHASSLPEDHPLRQVFKRLTSRNDPWTSGQWMTERPGGSDVQASETWAKYSPLPSKTGEYGRLDEGDYLISGFKFFSSATDANVAVLLAKTGSGKLSAFLAPLTKLVTDAQGRQKIVTNGIRIHHLKPKLGTKQLPTAELELKDVRAHLLGPIDRGVHTISTLLNVTRVYTFVGSIAGFWRCLYTAKSFAKARVTFGRPLWKMPLHLRTLADLELKRRALLHLSFFTTTLMGFVEQGFPRPLPPGLALLPEEGDEARIVLRALTATAKAVVSKVVIAGVQECMEALGGVGYIDDPDDLNFNIARAYRDLSVNSIWEGTTNVLSSEFIRFLFKDDNSLHLLARWMTRAIESLEDGDVKSVLERSWNLLRGKLEAAGPAELLGDGRRVMFTFAWLTCGMLLAADAGQDGDDIAQLLASRWILRAEGGVGEWVYRDVVPSPSSTASGAESDKSEWDSMLLYGVRLDGTPGKSKL